MPPPGLPAEPFRTVMPRRVSVPASTNRTRTVLPPLSWIWPPPSIVTTPVITGSWLLTTMIAGPHVKVMAPPPLACAAVIFARS